MSVIDDTRKALKKVHEGSILWTVKAIQEARQVFVLGNGGGAAHAMHFATDLRKIAGIRAHSFDSIPEMTARINDHAWIGAWGDWEDSFGFDRTLDCEFVFSVGGMNDGLSHNLPMAKHGIVGANGDFGLRIVIPSTSTPVIEGCQAVIAHDIVERLVR